MNPPHRLLPLRLATLARRIGLGSVLGAVLVVGLSAGAQDDAPRQSDLEERVEATEVTVPVQVLKNGQPVRGLTAANFELRVDGKVVPLTSFHAVDLSTFVPDAGGAGVGRVVEAARRHFLILFDFSHARVSTVGRARKAVADIVDQLHATDLVGVATYHADKGPNLVLGFTSDRDQVKKALLTLGAPDLIEKSGDPLGLTFVNPLAPDGIAGIVDRLPDLGAGDDPDGRRPMDAIDDVVAAHLEDMFREFEDKRKSAQKARVYRMVSDFEKLARMLGAIRAPKHVLMLSEGFDDQLFFADQDRANIGRMNEAAARGEIWNVKGDERFGDTTTQGSLNQLVQAFLRADCRIQAIDISLDDERGRSGGGRDALFAMADGTGGELIHSTNELGRAMSAVLERSEVSYELSFRPTEREGPGEYHKMKVKLVGSDRARLIYRPGYYEPQSFDSMQAMEKRLTAAEWMLSGQDRGDLDADLIAVPLPLGATRAGFVPTLMDVSGENLLLGHRDDTLPLEIYGYAFNLDGKIVDFFQQRASLDLTKVGTPLRERGLRFYAEFDVPAGKHSLRLLLLDPTSGRHRVLVRDVDVPGQGAAGLSPWMAPEGPGERLVLRLDRATAGRNANPFPFWNGERPFLPSASLRGETGGTLEGRVLQLGGAAPDTLSVRLDAATGETLHTLSVRTASSGAGYGEGQRWMDVSLDLADVEPGRYRLTVEGETGDSAPVWLDVRAAGS